ncbi:MAG: type II toxin-antitoxin system RelE/ParE family toxin [Kineosporiaceae bacterium]
MTYAVVWAEPAIDAAAGFLQHDAAGLSALMDVVDTLADDPYRTDSLPLGSLGLRRLATGRYRVLYEVVEDEAADDEAADDEAPHGGRAGAVTVIHVGRLG